MVPVGGDLVLVATANHSAGSDGTLLGTRVPLIAPMGEAFVAFSADSVVDDWLSGAGKLDDAEIDGYRARLQAIRDRGWSMSMAGPAEDRVLYADFRRRADGTLTPQQERELSTKVSELSRYYRSTAEPGDEPFDVHSIVAPVLGGDGRPAMVLRLSHLPGAVDGSTARAIGARLVDVARDIQRKATTGKDSK